MIVRRRQVKAASFPLLIAALGKDYHEGALLRMAEACGIPQSTLWRWLRGMPKKYTPSLVRQLCDYYDLEFRDVWGLIRHDEDEILAGKKIRLPELSHIRRGPVPLSGLRKRTARDRAAQLSL